MKNHFPAQTAFFAVLLFLSNCKFDKSSHPPLPEQYKVGGAYIKTLPYFNPDSCVMLVRSDVPKHWQGAVYENLFYGGPEDSPVELAFRHLDVYEKNFPADSARAFAQLYRGHICVAIGKNDSARTFLQDALDISLRIRHFRRASEVQTKLADLFYLEGKTAEALRTSLTAYEALKNLDSAQNLWKNIAISRIAVSYHQCGNLREAINWEQRRFPLIGNENIEAYRPQKMEAYMECGVIYTSMGKADSAIFVLQKALDLHEKYQLNTSKPTLLRFLGMAHLKNKDCGKALHLFNEARETLKNTPPDELQFLKSGMADAFRCLGNLDSAELLFKDCLKNAPPTQAHHAFIELSKISAQKGDFSAAFEALKTGIDIQEKYFGIEKMQEIGAAKISLELEKKQLQFEQLEQKSKNERQQKLIIALAALLGLGLAIGLFFRQQGKQQLLKQEKELAEAREHLKAQELERSQTTLKKTEKTLKTAQKELATTTELLEFKNRLLEELKMRLNDREGQTLPPLPGLKILTDADWGYFRQRFNSVFPGFLHLLKTRFPLLTPAETRLFLLVKLNFSSKEIAETLGISPESVGRSRHRLSHKIGLDKTTNLDAFVQAFPENQ